MIQELPGNVVILFPLRVENGSHEMHGIDEGVAPHWHPLKWPHRLENTLVETLKPPQTLNLKLKTLNPK